MSRGHYSKSSDVRNRDARGSGRGRLFAAAGWIAAACAVAWAAVLCCEPAGKREHPGKASGDKGAKAQPAAGAARGARSSLGKARKNWPGATQAGGQGRALSDEWDAESLYGLLGNVKPETAALAKRIRDAFSAKDFGALMACVDEAASCESPIVRAMMASSLGYYSRYTSLPEDEASVGIADAGVIGGSGVNVGGSNWLRLGDEDLVRMKAVLPAAKRFLDDANATVREMAAKAWIAGERRMDAGGERLAALREFFAKGNAAILEEFGRMSPVDVMGFCKLENNARPQWCMALSDAIERPLDGEYEALARQMYGMLMNVEYQGRDNMVKTVEWESCIRSQAEGWYSDPEDVQDMVRFATSAPSDEHDRALQIFEEVRSEYMTSSAAIAVARKIASVEAVIAERYGDTEERRAAYDKAVSEIAEEWKQLDAKTVAERERRAGGAADR